MDDRLSQPLQVNAARAEKITNHDWNKPQETRIKIIINDFDPCLLTD